MPSVILESSARTEVLATVSGSSPTSMFLPDVRFCAKSGHSPNVGGSILQRINFVLKSGLNSGALNFAVTPLLKSIQGRFIANLEVILRVKQSNAGVL
jgi:hypothetical protein